MEFELSIMTASINLGFQAKLPSLISEVLSSFSTAISSIAGSSSEDQIEKGNEALCRYLTSEKSHAYHIMAYLGRLLHNIL